MEITKTHHKLKVALVSIGIVIVLALVGAAALLVLAERAVSNYRGDTAAQLNDVTAGRTTGVPVTLRQIPFGEILNQDYRRVGRLDQTYQKLLTDTKSYIALRDAHDALVAQYNSGINGDKPLSGDVLIAVNKYQAVLENRFPNEEDQARAAGDLATTIASNSDFDAVSADIDSVLESGDRFLSELHDELVAHISDFQKQVNS